MMCRSLKVSRAGYYAWIDRPPSAHAAEDERLAVMVRAAHVESGRTVRRPARPEGAGEDE